MSSIIRRGVYSATTQSGWTVVNDMVIACYTDAVCDHNHAHAFISPTLRHIGSYLVPGAQPLIFGARLFIVLFLKHGRSMTILSKLKCLPRESILQTRFPSLKDTPVSRGCSAPQNSALISPVTPKLYSRSYYPTY